MPAVPSNPRVLIAVFATIAVAAGVLARAWSSPAGSDFALWILLCVLGEAMWLRLPVGNATLSMAITANFAAMLLLPTGPALAAIALSTVIAEATLMRKSPIRFLFNAAQSVLAAAAGIATLHALGGVHLASGRFGIEPALACLGAAAAYTAVNTAAVSLMIGLERGIAPTHAWRVNFGHAYEVVSNGTLFSLGLVLALLVARIGPGAVAMIALPVVLAWVSYRRMRPMPDELEESEEELDAA